MVWILTDVFNREKFFCLIKWPVVIGRCCNSLIPCSNHIVSKKHAIIVKDGDKLVIVDSSMNGTYVNGIRITAGVRQDLNQGDEIGFGSSRLQIVSNDGHTGPHYIFELTFDQNMLYKLDITPSESLPQAKAIACPNTNGEPNQNDLNCKGQYLQNVPINGIQLPPIKETLQEQKKLPEADNDSDDDCVFVSVMDGPLRPARDAPTEPCEDVKPKIDELHMLIIAEAQKITEHGSEHGSEHKSPVHQEISNDIIEIDDDDDDDLLCSQLFIKKEPCDEDYMKIKQEIADLDCFEKDHYLSPILLDSDNEDDCDLLEILSRSHTALPETTTPMDWESDITTNDSTSTVVEQEVPPVETEKSPNIEEQEAVPSTSGLTQQLKKIAKTINDKHAKNQSKVISPLPMPPRRMSSIPKKHSAPERKRKCASPKRPAKANVKISENRGLYLMQMINTNPRKAKKPKTTVSIESSPPVSNVVDIHRAVETPTALRSVAEKIELTDSTKEYVPQKLSFAHLKTPAASSRVKCGDGIVPLQPTDHISRLENRTNLLLKHPDPIPPVREAVATRTLPPVAKYPINVRKPKFSPTHDQASATFTAILPFIKQFINWNGELLEKVASKDIDVVTAWPQIAGKEIKKMTDTFESFECYKEAMESVVIGDMFCDILQDYYTNIYESNKGTFMANIEKVCAKDGFTELTCVTYIDEAMVAQQPLTTYHLVSFLTKTKIGVLRSICGYVAWNYKRRILDSDKFDDKFLAHCNTRPTWKQRFIMLIKQGTEHRENQTLLCRDFGTVRAHIKKLSGIRRVQGTLDNFILKPKYEQFIVSDSAIERCLETPNSMASLNKKQRIIVNDALQFCSRAEEAKLFLIEGPPGTGKSFVIVNILFNLIKSGGRVLLLTQSNNAIEHLVDVIKSLNQSHIIKMVRIGKRCENNDFHIDHLAINNLKRELYKASPQLKVEHDNLRAEVSALSGKKHRSVDDDIILNVKKQEFDNFVKSHYGREYLHLYINKRKILLDCANLVCSTIGSCITYAHDQLQNRFDCCIVDEATQATEQDVLMPLVLGVDKFILVGDTQQLPAFNNSIPKEYLFSRSLYARLKTQLQKMPNNPIRMLCTQYRMVPEICSFPNKKFYEGRLITANKRTPRKDLRALTPYLIFEYSPQSLPSDSNVNVEEVDIVMNIIYAINDGLKLNDPLRLSIITPYNHQRVEIDKRLTSNRHRYSRLKHPISCSTIDGFQGQERDVIILSLVRHDLNSFLNHVQRLNVGLTRAKSAMYVIASEPLLNRSGLLLAMRADAIERNLLVSFGKKRLTVEQLQAHVLRVPPK